MKYLVVGTAGHIDHGKSALVEALTGTNPDRLEEEKRRGITIDLGFAHLDMGDGLRVAFVDVPGHERFVKNMLAGVGGIDMVLLVVAADESVKPQTREHFQICSLLGIQKGLVAITKIDLVDREMADLVALEIHDLVRGSFLEGAPIVPVSARTGNGFDSLKSEIRRLSLEISPRPADRPFRLPIDRSFVMKGFGAVVTGTLVTGRIPEETEAEIFPLGRRVRVRGIEVHNQTAAEAIAGQRTALNLVGIEARELTRGMVLTPPGLFQASTRLDCALDLLPSARPLKTRSRVHFHCGTAEAVAEVVLLDTKELKPGERACAQLRLADAGLFLPGDRFIIRQFSPLVTLAGGVVLDNLPAKHNSLDEDTKRLLEALEHGDAEQRLELLAKQYDEAPPLALVARTGWDLAELMTVAKRLENQRRILILGSPPALLVHSDRFNGLSQRALTQVEEFHKGNPLASGIAKEDLRGRIANGAGSKPSAAPPSALLFNALLDALSRQGKVDVQGEVVRLKGREIQLSAEETRAKAEISRAFENAGLAVPSARAVIDGLGLDRPRAEKLLQILLREKTLVRVAEDLIFHQSSLSGLRQRLLQRKAQSNQLSVATFKEMTGVSRKYAIPLLEYLDRERVTRRQGDERVIL